MSVINKMLKDLDERQETADVNPAGQYAQVGNTDTTRPRTNVFVFLLAGILIVLMAIGWQLIFNNKPQQSPDSNSLQQKGAMLTSESASLDPASELEPAPDPALELSSPPEPELDERSVAAEINESSVDVVTQTVDLSNEEPEIRSPQRDLDVKIETAETPLPQAVPEVTSKVKPEPTFSIKKTTSQLTPEEHVEKLMTKAEDAYDKGYITEAIEQLTKVLSISDSHIEARNLLAAAWYGRGEAARAITIINDGLQRYPMIEAWRLTAAKIFFKENNSGGAFSYLNINLSNASKEFYTLKGNLARELKDFAKAEQAYAELTKMEPHIGSWWLGLAIAQDSQNKAEDALTSYKKVMMTGGVSRQSIEFSQQRIAELEG